MGLESAQQQSRPEIKKKPYTSETLTTGKEIIAKVLSLIGQAKHTIDLQFYTFEADSTGRKVLEALAQAKEKNPTLKIRLLADDSIDFRHGGKYVWFDRQAKAKRDETYELINKMKDQGILDAKITNWFPHNPLLISNIFHRDHKKQVLIDGSYEDAVGLVTSANIAEFHENVRKEVGRVYYDHGVNGPVPFLQKDFDYSFENAKRWEFVYDVRNFPEYFRKHGIPRRRIFTDFWGSLIRNPQKHGERMVFTPGPKGYDEAVLTDSFWGKIPGVYQAYEKIFHKKMGAKEATNEVLTMLDLAQEGDEVIIFSPYPGKKFLTKSLLSASKRGVDTHLVISSDYSAEFFDPKNPKSPLDHLASYFFANWPRTLTSGGVKFYEYNGDGNGQKGALHAKGAVWIRKDGTARTLIGSTNFSKNLISGMNREIAVVEEADHADPLIKYAKELIHNSKLFTLPNNLRRGKLS